MRKGLGATLVASIVLAISLPALTQDTTRTERAFSVQNFLLAPGNDNYLTLEGATVPTHLRFRLGGFLGYQFSPLRLRACARVDEDRCARWADDQTALIAHHTSFELVGAFSFNQILEIGLAMPFVLYQAGDDLEAADGSVEVEGPRRATGIGDLRLHLKLDLLHGLFRYKGDKFGLAFVPVFSVPTGNAAIPDSFMGHKS
ncbi:MAG: hypothetical protein MUC50_12515, partial [Myxococcota bacterium]|nr:hypothetical protein [Myxococcota bacterium]